MDYDSKIKEIADNIARIKKEMDVVTTQAELWNLGKQVRVEVNKLKIALEAYFQFERDNNLPLNLSHRSVYKSLKKFRNI